MITIDLDASTPLVEQIRAEIRAAIARGDVAPGSPLPTVRQLAADLGVNLNTVARAYRLLEAEGLVTTLRGRGTVVRSSRESPAIAGRSRQRKIGRRIRQLISDARLAGLDRADLERLFAREASTVWPRE